MRKHTMKYAHMPMVERPEVTATNYLKFHGKVSSN